MHSELRIGTGNCGRWQAAALAALLLAVAMLTPYSATAAEAQVYSNRPNAIEFETQKAKFVRFVVHETSTGSQACVDELEVYGPRGDDNLALAEHGALATASSVLPSHAIHQIRHLNDGRFGNSCSWIPAGGGTEWAQIELPEASLVSKVVFSRDRLSQYGDRVPVRFEVQLSLDGQTWQTVKEVTTTTAAVALHARGSGGGLPVPPPTSAPRYAASTARVSEDPAPDDSHGGVTEFRLRMAYLGEEHAWLKTYGRADLSPRLVPYNGRVKEYPRHKGDDRLPLPVLSSAPELDGRLDDACWREASQGAVRVAHPYDVETCPMVCQKVTAGRDDTYLYLALDMDRIMSGHLAVISTGDQRAGGVLLVKRSGLVFNTHNAKGSSIQLAESSPVEAAHDESRRYYEARLPLDWFPGCEESGLRVGLGLGGKHTERKGRPVDFVFSPLAIAQDSPCLDGVFQVRLSAQDKVTVSGNAPELKAGLTLEPGDSRVIRIEAKAGGIGPELDLSFRDDKDEQYALHLLRYDPMGRTLGLMEEMIPRMAFRGIDVAAERETLAGLQKRHDALMASAPALEEERAAFFKARDAKRALFLREPDLEPIEQVLFVKRLPFEPSHNYSVLLDSRYRGGGSVCRLDVPRGEGRFQPEGAQVTALFESGEGIARTPTADFDLDTIYFAYRPSRDGYFHIMAMDPDGNNLKQLTDGPFHDFWPCPLPDGDLAVVSTRCRQRFLCWRPQAFVLFRMKPGGTDFRPLSYANLSEWAPSVMNDGRLIWTRSEYQDKGADFGHTLWAIRPDGSQPELVFGNTIIQPNGYANGRQVPGTQEFSCTLISHFGDLNGPIALVDTGQGRFKKEAITSLTPEVPWPGNWPLEECFRDAVPLAQDFFLCSHAPARRFGIFVIDRYGNRELVYADPSISSMCPTPYRVQPKPPVLNDLVADAADQDYGEIFVQDVYQGLEPAVQRGQVKYLRVCEEVRAHLDEMPDGTYRDDHPSFQDWYATPVHKVSGPFGWTTYVAKAPLGLVPVEEDGSAHFRVPAGKVLYFQVLDKDLNELQRMRSVVHVQPGERRSCIGCHEGREYAPANGRRALAQEPRDLDTPDWAGVPFSYEKVVQPVLDAKCISCHDAEHPKGLDLTGTLALDKVPTSYRTLVSNGLVHYADMQYNAGGCEFAPPLTLGTLKSKVWQVLDAGHHDVELTRDEMRRFKTWIDLNCPLWPDYINRNERPGPGTKVARAE